MEYAFQSVINLQLFSWWQRYKFDFVKKQRDRLCTQLHGMVAAETYFQFHEKQENERETRKCTEKL